MEERAPTIPCAARRNSADDQARTVRLHESIATLLAGRGRYEAAYRHLRAALDIVADQQPAPERIPEQLAREVAQLRRDHAEVKEQSLRDSLTDVYNRRYLDQQLPIAVNQPRELAVAIADLDRFKTINDTHGHRTGDRVLQQVAVLLREQLPVGGCCVRYGGEEFVLLMPGVDAPGALRRAETARLRIAEYDWSRLAPGLHVTTSIGVHHQPAGSRLDGDTRLIIADQLLYHAKRSGRNAVVYGDDTQAVLDSPATPPSKGNERYGHLSLPDWVIPVRQHPQMG